MWEAHGVAFSLGFEGERWVPEIPALVIPVGHGDSIMAVRYSPTKGGPSGSAFAMVVKDNWYECDDMLMLASLVRDYIDGLQEKALVGAGTGTPEGS